MKFLGAKPTNPEDIVPKSLMLYGSVASTAPSSPAVGDLWIDTSEPGVTEFSDFGSGTPTIPGSGMKLWARTRAGRRMAAVMGPSGLDTSLQPFLATNQVRLHQPIHNTTGNFAFGDSALTATATATAAAVAGQTTASSTALHLGTKRLDYLAASASNSIAGFRQSSNHIYVSSAAGMGGFFFVCRFSPATGQSNTTKRCFVGVSNNTAAPTDVDPSTLTNMLGVGYNSADTNWQILNGGTVAGGKTATSVAKGTTDRPGIYECAIFVPPGSLQATIQFTDLFAGTTQSATIPAGTGAPASGTTLSGRGYCSSGTATASLMGITLFSMYIETDY